jgi:hypothetical protein
VEVAASGDNDEWSDPCQEFAHSVLFFMTVFFATTGWIIYIYTSFKT